MRRSGGLFGEFVLLVEAAIVSAPGRAEDIPFVRTEQERVIDRGPLNPGAASELGLEIQPITHCVQAEKARGNRSLFVTLAGSVM